MPRTILCYPYAPDLRGLDAWDDSVITLGSDAAGWPNPHIGLDPDTASIMDLMANINETAQPGDILLPIAEEAVLACSLAGMMTGKYHSLSWPSALACTDRAVQRRLLDISGLNPAWGIDRRSNRSVAKVVKGVASMYSQGIHIVGKDESDAPAVAKAIAGSDNRMQQLLCQLCPPPYTFIVEELLRGSEYEVSGVTHADGVVTMFHPLKQHWSHPGGHITKYERAGKHLVRSICQVAKRVLSTLDMNLGGWCIEFMFIPDAPSEAESWKVIEVNGRLGWEPAGIPYFELMSDYGNPYDVLMGRPAMQASSALH